MFASIYSMLEVHHREWLLGVTAICIAILVSLFAHDIFFRLLNHFRTEEQQLKKRSFFLTVIERLRRPARLVVVLTAIAFVLHWVPIPAIYLDLTHKVLG